MKINNMLKASRQIMFETEFKGFDYAIGGSGFLCRYQGFDFIVTAKHVVKGVSPNLFRVLHHSQSRNFVPHNGCLTMRIPDTEDTDWGDLAIFPLERSLYEDNDFGDEQPYLLPGSVPVWQPGMNGYFVMRGFPHDRSGIDFDAYLIKQQAVILEADAVGPSPMKLCIEIKFRDVSPCTSLNGFSGTPVFWIGDEPPHQHCFAGLMLRGDHGSKQGHFLKGDILLEVLRRHLG
jgi:hypothetical protein